MRQLKWESTMNRKHNEWLLPAMLAAIIVLGLFAILLMANIAAAQTYHGTERSYQVPWCYSRGGETEVVMQDGTRADCVTDEYAIEFDFGHKWYEAVSQSLWYSLQTNKPAGIVLILESKDEYKYWVRLNTLIGHFELPIHTWAVGAGAP